MVSNDTRLSNLWQNFKTETIFFNQFDLDSLDFNEMQKNKKQKKTADL